MYAISIAPSRSAGGTFFIEGLEHVGGRILVWSSPDDPSTFERSKAKEQRSRLLRLLRKPWVFD